MTRPYQMLVAVMVALALLSSSAGAVYRDPGPTGPVPGKFIVKLKKQVRAEALNQALGRSHRLEKFSPVQLRGDLKNSEGFSRVHVFYSDSRSLAAADVTALLGADNVEYVEPDYYVEFFAMPSDSLKIKSKIN